MGMGVPEGRTAYSTRRMLPSTILTRVLDGSSATRVSRRSQDTLAMEGRLPRGSQGGDGEGFVGDAELGGGDVWILTK
jgi:hypothetical protein